MDNKTLLIIAGIGAYLLFVPGGLLDKWRREAPFRAQQQKRERLEREAAARRAIHEARQERPCASLTPQQLEENIDFMWRSHASWIDPLTATKSLMPRLSL